MDVTNKDSIANALKVVEEKEGRLDILVNKSVHFKFADPSLQS